MEIIAETAPPKTRLPITKIKSFFERAVFAIIKNITVEAKTGMARESESYIFLERSDESKTATAKIPTGRLNGFEDKISFFSRTETTDQRRSRILAETTRKICLGRIKGSVVVVKKNRGKRKINRHNSQREILFNNITAAGLFICR